MQVLEWMAICCAAATLAWSLSHVAPDGARAGAWEWVLPAAMLGATAGIALGLLGDGPLWSVGGMILLSVGTHDVVSTRAFEALFAAPATAPTVSKQQMVLTAVASALAAAVFVMA